MDKFAEHVKDNMEIHNLHEERLELLENENMKQQKKIDRLVSAVFGDGNGSKGMEAKVDEIHKVFTASSLMRKWTVRFIGFIGILAGAIIGILELIKRLKN